MAAERVGKLNLLVVYLQCTLIARATCNEKVGGARWSRAYVYHKFNKKVEILSTFRLKGPPLRGQVMREAQIVSLIV